VVKSDWEKQSLAEILFDSWFVKPCGKLVGEQTLSSIPEAHKKFFLDPKRPSEVKAAVGWGGLVLLSEDVCPVQLMVSFFEQVQAKSCGKCFPCRVGSRVIYDLLWRRSSTTFAMALSAVSE
jgi:NADH:ubiquinone oxidoreductase subunit F (NADH-binding)